MSNTRKDLPIAGTGLSLHVAVGQSTTTITYPNEAELSAEQLEAFMFLIMNVDVRKLNHTMAGLLSSYSHRHGPIPVADWIDLCNLQQFAQLVSFAS